MGINNISILNPKSFENLINLKELSVEYNQLETFDANLRNCTKLQNISLDGNKLKLIDVNAFSGLNNLKEAKFSGNV
jgi:Leucine-rich repeat (LRR) protein